MNEKILVIGGSHAAAQFVVSLTELRSDVDLTVFSDDAYLPYHRPPLSKAFLKDTQTEIQLIRAAELYQTNNITFHLNTRITAIDANAKTVTAQDGTSHAYDRLALAVGTQVRKLTCPGAEAMGVYYLRSAGDAQAQRKKLHAVDNVVVIGGGFIGLEAAATARSLGKSVTVLEMAPGLMGRAVTAELAGFVETHHRNAGIDIRCGTGLTSIETDGNRAVAVLTDQGDRIAADMVIAGIGVVPRVELAEAAGIVCNNGIEVERDLRTSLADIYAIGDCTSFINPDGGGRLRLESVQNANDQAKCLAQVLAGQPVHYEAVPWFWSDQGALKLQMVGLSAGADKTLQLGEMSEIAFSLLHFCNGRLIAADSVNKPGDHMAVRRLMDLGGKLEFDQAAQPDFSLRDAVKAVQARG